MREQVASDKPVASAISLSEYASSFGTISRLNHTSSRSLLRCHPALRQRRRRSSKRLKLQPGIEFRKRLTLRRVTLSASRRETDAQPTSCGFGLQNHIAARSCRVGRWCA